MLALLTVLAVRFRGEKLIDDVFRRNDSFSMDTIDPPHLLCFRLLVYLYVVTELSLLILLLPGFTGELVVDPLGVFLVEPGSSEAFWFPCMLPRCPFNGEFHADIRLSLREF